MQNSYLWYSTLIKPFWAPPSWLFGPAWTFLYIIIAVTFGFVIWQAIAKKITWKTLLPFLLNLAFNFSFTPLQFGLRNNYLAAIDIILVLITLIWAIRAIWPRYRWVAIANIPYLLWVCFATTLQLTVTYLNR